MNLQRGAAVGACLAAIIYSSAAGAVDGVAGEIGWGDENSIRGGLAAQWDWHRELLHFGDWYLGGLWEVSGSYWDGDSGSHGDASLGEIGFTPVFRVQPHSTVMGVTPYLEGAIGVHLFSDTTFGDRDFDIAFSFGDHLGAGIRFGSRGEFDLGYRYQHLSNCSIGDTNPGINFHLLRLGYHF